MEFKYKKKVYNIPASLQDYTLGQRIEFDEIHGEEIRQLHQEVFKKGEDGNELEPDELEVMMMSIAVATMNLSFFTGIPIQEVQENISVDDVMNIYYSCFHQLNEQQDNLDLRTEFLWNDEFWYLESPELSYDSKITFNELITSKQIVKQMAEVGAGNWQGMLYLSAIYLKRKDEQFEESWMQEGSERLELMKDLPLDIALNVAFFLQSSMTMYMKTFQSLKAVEMEKDRT